VVKLHVLDAKKQVVPQECVPKLPNASLALLTMLGTSMRLSSLLPLIYGLLMERRSRTLSSTPSPPIDLKSSHDGAVMAKPRPPHLKMATLKR
jgi:hypothetical protein